MINVTCAIIRNDENKILVVRHGGQSDHPYKWEFPGGKVENGESEEDCIIREIREELDIDIVICSKLTAVEHNYGKKEIRLIPFVCDTLDDAPVLTEHSDFKWIDLFELKEMDFSEADIPVSKEYALLFDGDENNNVADAEDEKVEESIDDPDLKELVVRMMSRLEAEFVANIAIEKPAVFKKLLDFSITEEKKLAFRSSWILTKVCDKYPELMDPYIPDIITRLNGFDNESVQRSFLKIISSKDINQIDVRFHGILADYCFLKLNSGLTAIAIRAYVMDILYNLSTIYPEIANELVPAIMLLTEEGSAGIVARGKMILKKLNG